MLEFYDRNIEMKLVVSIQSDSSVETTKNTITIRDNNMYIYWVIWYENG